MKKKEKETARDIVAVSDYIRIVGKKRKKYSKTIKLPSSSYSSFFVYSLKMID